MRAAASAQSAAAAGAVGTRKGHPRDRGLAQQDHRPADLARQRDLRERPPLTADRHDRLRGPDHQDVAPLAHTGRQGEIRPVVSVFRLSARQQPHAHPSTVTAAPRRRGHDPSEPAGDHHSTPLGERATELVGGAVELGGRGPGSDHPHPVGTLSRRSVARPAQGVSSAQRLVARTARLHPASSRSRLAASMRGAKVVGVPVAPWNSEALRHTPRREPGQPRRTQCGRLDHSGPAHRDAQQVRLELHQEFVGGGAAVHAQLGRSHSRVGFLRAQHVDRAVGHRLERRPYQVLAPRATREPEHAPARFRDPVRGAQPDQGGHEVDAVGIRHAPGQRLGFRGVLDQAQAVPEPLHRGARDEDGALERERGSSGLVACGRGEQPVRARDQLLTREQEQEGAGPVRVLGESGPGAPLPEERGLLVTGHAGHRHLDPQRLPRRDAEVARAPPHLGQKSPRHLEQVEQFRLPGAAT